MLLHAMLLRYTSNIKVEEGMEKRATRANSTRNGRERESEGERERGEASGRKEVERTAMREGEREEREERRRRWDHATIMYTRRVINICFRSPPPAAVIRKRGSLSAKPTRLRSYLARTGSTGDSYARNS